MKKTQILSEARRRFSEEAKASMLLEMAEAGTSIADFARQYEISPSLLYKWRRESTTSSAFMRIVPSNFASASSAAPRSIPSARICTPFGVVIEFGSPISMDDIAYLASKVGGRG
ncbi:MAG: transposase [Chitinophagaceae bacterium]|nr:transposase [Oligoflexus sp.]